MADEKKEEKQEEKKEATVVRKPKKLGKVVTITSSRIVVDVKGNGEEIKFDSVKHSSLKVGDEIEIT